jgi:hypothetical protein
MSMMMNEVMMRAMKNFGDEVSSKAITICAEKYGFSAEEALRELGGVLVSQKPKEIKERKEKPKKPSMALPFNGEFNPNLCHALRQNSGLYTQCQSGPTKGVFCNNCHKLAEKAEDGIPEYGLIQQRMEAYSNGVEYVDPKGRKPVAYLKVMKKYKLTQEQVLEEAGKFGIEINPVHFEAPADTRRGRPAVKPKEPKEANAVKGRPKKEKKVIIAEDDDDDLFASLVASANEDEENEIVIPSKKSAEEKEAERLAKEEEKAAKLAALAAEKAEKEAKLAAAKAEKEAKLAAEKAEKEAKLAAEKAEKEAKLVAAKAEKEAKLAALAAEKQAKADKLAAEKLEKEAKLAAEKAEKEAKLAAAKAEKEAKLAAEKLEKEAKLAAKKKKPDDEDEEPEVVKKITFEDKKYLLSKKSGVIYDYEKYASEGEQVVVGKWSEEAKKIIFDKAEESADEYESDSDSEE